MPKRKKKQGWHNVVYAGQKSRRLYEKGKVKAIIPIPSSGQGFTKKKRRRKK